MIECYDLNKQSLNICSADIVHTYKQYWTSNNTPWNRKTEHLS